MSEFLIVHKVHGQPAFDIATKLDQGTPTDPGPWWILIDGHRAYPYFTVPLEDLYIGSVPIFEAIPDIPDGCRDFHTLTKAEPARKVFHELNLEDLDL